jgi:hypothetical protein
MDASSSGRSRVDEMCSSSNKTTINCKHIRRSKCCQYLVDNRRTNGVWLSPNEYYRNQQIGNICRHYRRHFFDALPMYQKDILGHHGCVNAIEFSSNGERLLASGW